MATSPTTSSCRTTTGIQMNPDKMSERELRNEVKMLRHFIAISGGLKCPSCDDDGWVQIADDAKVQCPFCYEVPDSIFARSQDSPPDYKQPVKHEFIYTVPGKKADPQMCYRLSMPYTPMTRWVRCRLIDGHVVLGKAHD